MGHVVGRAKLDLEVLDALESPLLREAIAGPAITGVEDAGDLEVDAVTAGLDLDRRVVGRALSADER